MERINTRLWKDYMRYKEGVYEALIPDHVQNCLVSETNWAQRLGYESAEELGMRIVPGDICYMDFGQAYLNEAGYQHFGLIMCVYQKKALVIPMTSNPNTYARAYDPITQPRGKKHLMRIGLVRGLVRPSVLFLNDMKFVNTARVIDVKAHIPVDSAMFRDVQKRMMNILTGKEDT